MRRDEDGPAGQALPGREEDGGRAGDEDGETGPVQGRVARARWEGGAGLGDGAEADEDARTQDERAPGLDAPAPVPSSSSMASPDGARSRCGPSERRSITRSPVIEPKVLFRPEWGSNADVRTRFTALQQLDVRSAGRRSGGPSVGAAGPGPDGLEQHTENGAWPFTSLRRASSIDTHSTRSTSGNSRIRPEPRGHSSSNVLLDECVTSRSAVQGPHADPLATGLAAFPEEDGPPTGSGRGRPPLRTRGRRRRAASSPGRYSPLGTDQAASSLRAQNGPPGWAIRTSTASARGNPVQQEACTGRAHGSGHILPPGPAEIRHGLAPGFCIPRCSREGPRCPPSARGRVTAPRGWLLARLSSRSGGPSRSLLGGTGFGRSIRSHVFQLNTAR